MTRHAATKISAKNILLKRQLNWSHTQTHGTWDHVDANTEQWSV